MNPQTDIDAANDACTDHRKDMSAEEIKIFTDHVTSMQPCVLADVFRMWNLEHPGKEMSYSVAAKYVNYHKREGKYYVPEKRGPKSLLSKEETQKLLERAKLSGQKLDSKKTENTCVWRVLSTL